MSFKYPDPTPIFPVLPVGFSTHMKPTVSNKVLSSVSGYVTRSPDQVYPLWEFNLTFEVLRTATLNAIQDTNYINRDHHEFESLLGLFLMCLGQYGRFYFSCPEDNSRSGQIIGAGDGALTAFTIIRTWGTQYIEPVGGVDMTHSIVVKLNGTPTAAYSIEDNIITFDSPPGNGVAITMDFYFYYFCRFLDDVQDFEQFMHNLWMTREFKFRSVKR